MLGECDEATKQAHTWAHGKAISFSFQAGLF